MRSVLAWCVAAAVAAAGTPAHAAWQEAKTPHFVIYSEQKPDEVRDFATRLEKFDSAVRSVRKMPDPPLSESGKLTVYVLRDQETVARMAGAEDSGIAGFYLADISGARAYVYRKPGKLAEFDFTPEVVFFHEYYHHLMLGYTDVAVPSWLVEGSAEFFSTASFEDDGSVMLGRAAKHRAVGLFLLTDLSLQQMLGDSYKELNGGEFEMLYARGWLLTHYLTFEPSRQGQLERYLALIQGGQTPTQAAQSAFGDLRQLAKQLDGYMKRKTLPGLRVPADQVRLGTIALRQLSDAEATAVGIRMRLERRSRLYQADAKHVAEDARRAATRFSTDALVQATLGRAELAAGNADAAIVAADRALTLDAKNVTALIAKAQAGMKLARGTPKTADWTAIRALLLTANRADPENAQPLALFYQTFTAAGVPPTPNATAGLLYARVLMPQDDELRLIAARQLIVDGKFSDAVKTLAPMAYDPHGKHHDLAAKAVTAASSNDRAAALAAVDELNAKRKKDEEG